ncbi:Uu.00g086730.m01.CDS01 [Anthostomella pinea]|uniref:Uu.00g086730.m01.CDS01 n=1 Tax=Anthostomella pinea TaxID=933095 RepID=A0AAI8YJY5_9PEZI|nr:Uu.00g086730.m01.CDS01 [Anthostomella pinea]
MLFTKTTVLAALIAAVNAHMMMSSPSPFDPAALDNFPLDPKGIDFPCKIGHKGYTLTGGTTNNYELGSSQTLSFVGTAVHGGGSCQVVLTYDNPPTKDSKWKVIHSIEGGCPAKNQIGNLPGDSAAAADPYTYPYTIPTDIPAGKGTIAFTWFNRVGNREMYMNCGALELTGTGGDEANFDKLPDMVIFNIAPYPILPETTEDNNMVFADPGDSVENNLAIGGFGSYTTGGSGGASAAPAAPSSTADAGGAGGVFITVPVGGDTSAAPAATATATTPSTAQVPATTLATTTSAAAVASPASGSGSSSGSTSGALSGACTSEGMFNCIGGSSFQQCASGTWSAVIAMAPGTKCTEGQSANMAIAAAKKVRAFQA